MELKLIHGLEITVFSSRFLAVCLFLNNLQHVEMHSPGTHISLFIIVPQDADDFMLHLI